MQTRRFRFAGRVIPVVVVQAVEDLAVAFESAQIRLGLGRSVPRVHAEPARCRSRWVSTRRGAEFARGKAARAPVGSERPCGCAAELRVTGDFICSSMDVVAGA